MTALVILLSMFVVFPTADMQEFSRHSNGVAEYVFISQKTCETGLRNSGFALVPFRSVSVKQKNADGSVTRRVCEN